MASRTDGSRLAIAGLLYAQAQLLCRLPVADAVDGCDRQAVFALGGHGKRLAILLLRPAIERIGHRFHAGFQVAGVECDLAAGVQDHVAIANEEGARELHAGHRRRDIHVEIRNAQLRDVVDLVNGFDVQKMNSGDLRQVEGPGVDGIGRCAVQPVAHLGWPGNGIAAGQLNLRLRCNVAHTLVGGQRSVDR